MKVFANCVRPVVAAALLLTGVARAATPLDGIRDPGFGTNGLATASFNLSTDYADHTNGMAVSPSGRIYITATIGVVTQGVPRLRPGLARFFADGSAAPVGAVDGRAIHADITALNSAFSRAPHAYRNIGRMAQSIVGILDKQNRDVSQALKVADEYAGTIDRNRAALGMMVRSLASIERSLLDNRASVTACLQMLAEMLSRAVTLEPASATYLEPVLDKLGESEPALRSLAGKLDSAITTVRSTMRRLVAAAGPDGLSLDQSATTVDGSALCVPIPGRRC